jgi:hypothetical protein
VVLLLFLLAWPAAANDDCTAHTADDARGSGEDVRGENGPPEGGRALNGAQPEASRQRRLAVNLFLCANGLPGCDESLLSPEERARFAVPPAQQ